MNFKITIDPPTILSTGAATDGSTVFGSLKMARAALDDGVKEEIVRAWSRTATAIEDLEAERDHHIAALRAARKAALKVREADLPSDEPAHAIDDSMDGALA